MAQEKQCPYCGGNLIEKESDLAANRLSLYEGDDVALITNLVCDKCGRDFEVIDPTSEDRQSLEYWKS